MSEVAFFDWQQFAVGNHRAPCPMCGKSAKDKTMTVTLRGMDDGVCHCHRCGYVDTLRAPKEAMTREQRREYAQRLAAQRAQQEADVRARHEQVARAAHERWNAALPALEHSYLARKGVGAHGVRIEANHTLLIPMKDAAGKLWSLQSISPDGTKRFMPGGRTKGCFHQLHGLRRERVLICEGYATGATLHESTAYTVIVAFNSGNLLPVAQAVDRLIPHERVLVICADDDWMTEGNPGRTAANEAARAVGAKVAFPNFDGLPREAHHTDFNDLNTLFYAKERT